MSGIQVYLFLLYTIETVHNQEPPTTPPISENNTLVPANSSQPQPHPPLPENGTLSDEYDWQPPEVVLNSASGVDIPDDPKIKNQFSHKPLAVHLIQKFSKWVRPVYEKLCKVKEFLSYPNHPSHGGVNTQEFWERWHEKGHHYLTGINGAIYGFAPSNNHDYPFAYRKLPSAEKSTNKKN